MPETSARISLPLIQPSQAQKHVTHNEAIVRLDATVQLTIMAFDLAEPPAVPQEGDLFSLAASPTGAWAGQGGALAYFSNGGWIFISPHEGWRAWDLAASEMRIHLGGGWQTLTPQLQNIVGLGIGTTSDATNRLAVASDASLFTHDGNGHQVKVDKASADETASLLFQDNFSGRAEIGLIGDDDLQFKVSPDGTNFEEALRIRSADGVVEAKCLMSGKVDVQDDGVALIPTPGGGGIVVVSMVNPLYAQTTHNGIYAYDSGLTLSLTTLASGGNLMNLGAVVPTGATGPNGGSGIAVGTGQLYFENRHGGMRTYAYTFLNTD